MDDLDDLLPRAQALHDFLPQGFLLYRLGELFYDLEINVGFQKGDPDFLQSLLQMLFGDSSFTLEVLKNALQFFG